MILPLLFAFVANAQTPLSLTMPAAADEVETLVVSVDNAVSKRFIDDPAPAHVTFAKGAEVRVLFREAGQVRVREGDKYGWLPESSLQKAEPE